MGVSPQQKRFSRDRRNFFPRTSFKLKLTDTSEKLTATLYTQHDIPFRWKRLTTWRFIDSATTTLQCRQQARYFECTRISCWQRRALLSIPVWCGRILINPGPFEQTQRQRFNDTRFIRVKSLPLIGIRVSLNKSFCIKKCFFRKRLAFSVWMRTFPKPFSFGTAVHIERKIRGKKANRIALAPNRHEKHEITINMFVSNTPSQIIFYANIFCLQQFLKGNVR